MDGKLKVSDYMVREVVSIPGLYCQEAINKLIATEFHGLPVEKDRRILGFVTAKELLRNIDRPDAKITEIIKPGTISLSPEWT